jgi:glycosyltransferase involved in cell wall biosynthesis
MENLKPAPDLAVILPAFNEADGIEDTLARVRGVLAAFSVTSEIIVVDDGSKDGTGAKAEAAGVRVITHKWNRGYGAALKTGVLATRARTIMIMDADCSYPPDAMPRLYARLNDADMVVGERRLSSAGVAWIAGPANGSSTGWPAISSVSTFRT